MKIAALILGILGGLAYAGWGMAQLSSYEESKAKIASLNKMVASLGVKKSSGPMAAAMAQLDKALRASYAALILGLLALVAAGLVFKLSKVSGGVMLLAAVIPAIFYPWILLFGFLLVLAGIFALVAKPKRMPVPA
jgi:hypothetical protein